MGKRDIRAREWVEQNYGGVSYRAFDLMEAGPERIEQMFEQVVEGMSRGELRALPVKTFGMGEAEGAFRWMAQARHERRRQRLADARR